MNYKNCCLTRSKSSLTFILLCLVLYETHVFNFFFNRDNINFKNKNNSLGNGYDKYIGMSAFFNVYLYKQDSELYWISRIPEKFYGLCILLLQFCGVNQKLKKLSKLENIQYQFIEHMF